MGRRDRPRGPGRGLSRPTTPRTPAPSGAGRFGVPGRLIGTLALGTSLNPLNSSMIAVALAQLQTDFGVGVATSSWLVSGFYVGAAVAQPLMGRLVDQLGARRLFLAGLLLVLVASALTPFVPGFWSLVALRVVQAFGTSTAYPSALVLIRAATPEGSAPTRGLGAITVANSSSAALGPVLGGFLVAAANAAGSKAEMVMLADVGFRGNSHMLMQDRNSLEVARWLDGWIKDHMAPKP